MPTPDSLGEYRILREIGRGGMGIVYLAHDPSLNRQVAIKVIGDPTDPQGRRATRLRNEAVAAARLRHPGIVGVHRIAEFDGVHCIVMEYVEGETLAMRLAETKRRSLSRSQRAPHPASPDADTEALAGIDPELDDAQLDETDQPVERSAEEIDEVCRLVAEAARALHHAHEHRVIHRDVKPQNLLVGPDDRVRVVDFGVAKDLDVDSITRSGDLVGSYHYMSPEQALAKRVAVDRRTDVYSLGVVLYELLTLRRPFAGSTTAQVLRKISFDPPRPIRQLSPRVPRDLETICLKAMEKNPSHRYATALQFAEDLERFRQHQPIRARRRNVLQRGLDWAERHRTAAAALVLSAVALGAAIAVVWPLPDGTVLEVTSTPPDARVAVQPVDWWTGDYGPPRTLGRTPLRERLPHGRYRIVLVTDDGRVGEFSRLLEPGAEDLDDGGVLRLDVSLRPREDVIAGMVAIDAADVETGLGGDANPQYPLRRVRSRPFLVDPTEVTNAQYRAFVEATGHPAPAHWDDTLDAGVEELPVIGVDWQDAVAYAEWAGKRLLTRVEWDRLARGPGSERLPWRSLLPADSVRVLACVDRDPRDDDDAREPFEVFRGALCPVGSHPRDRTAHGVHDLVGSVSEWSDSYATHLVGDRIEPARAQRLALGGAWSLPVELADRVSLFEPPAKGARTSGFVGFRTATSLELGWE